MAEVSFALLCPSRTAESHSQIVISTLLFRNLIARGAGSLRPSSGCTCFGLDQFLASASLVSHFSDLYGKIKKRKLIQLTIQSFKAFSPCPSNSEIL